MRLSFDRIGILNKMAGFVMPAGLAILARLRLVILKALPFSQVTAKAASGLVAGKSIVRLPSQVAQLG